MSKFILIQSNQTVRVTRGLDVIDNTNYNSDIPNRANFRPNWTKSTVIIKAGQFAYPIEITEWQSVKALEKDGVLTIGKELEDGDAKIDENAKKADERLQEGKAFEEFNANQNNNNKTKRSKKVELKDVDLDEIAKEGE